MAIVQRGTASYAYANATSVTLTAPAGFTVGDILIACVSDYSTGSAATAPTGWTGVTGWFATGGSIAIYVAQYGMNGLTGTSWIWTGGVTRMVGYIVGCSGAIMPTWGLSNRAAVINAAGTRGVATTDMSAPTSNSLVIAGFVSLGGTGAWSAESFTNVGAMTELGTEYAGTYFDMVMAAVLASAPLSGGITASQSVSRANGCAAIVLGCAVAPTVTAAAANPVADTTATGNGNVTSDGGSAITERGVVWGTSASPTKADNYVIASGTTGAFTAAMTGLPPGTLIYFRMYAINPVGTTYSTGRTFTTWLTTAPAVTDSAPSNIADTTATGNGNVNSNGGPPVTGVGVCWSTVANPTMVSHPGGGSAAGSPYSGAFTAAMSGMTPNTLYYWSMYAFNSVGTTYSTGGSFTPGAHRMCPIMFGAGI